MQFLPRLWRLSILGWLSLTSWSLGAAAMPSVLVNSPHSWGGIPVSCRMQQINQLRNPSARRKAIAKLFEIYTRTGQDSHTLELIAALPPQEEIAMKAETLLWIAHFTRINGDQSRAKSLVAQAGQWALKLDQTPDRNPYLWQHIGEELIALGQSKTATAALAESMQAFRAGKAKDSLEQAQFFFDLAKLYIALGKSATAVELLDQSSQLVRSLPNDKSQIDKAWLLATISLRYGMAGEPIKANARFAESLKLATASPNRLNRAEQLLQVLKATLEFSSADDLAQFPTLLRTQMLTDQDQKSNQVLTQLLATTQSLKERGEILQSIALSEVTNHRSEQAVQLAKTQPDPEDRFFMLIVLLPATPSPDDSNQVNQTLSLLEQALNAAHAIQDRFTQYSALLQVASAYAEWGQRSQALQTIEDIQDDDQKQNAKFQVVAKLALAGQSDQAFALAQTLPPDPKEDPDSGMVPNRKSAVLGKIALGYARIGQFDRASQIAASIPPSSIKNQTLIDMADALTRLGKTQQAATLLPQVTNMEMRYRELYDMADLSLTTGNLDAALALASTSPPPGLLDSIYTSRQELLGEIATAYAGAGQYDKAIQIAQTLPDRSLIGLFSCAQSSSVPQPQTFQNRMKPHE